MNETELIILNRSSTNPLEELYRTKQTSVAAILLAEKTADLTYSFLHLCKKNNISITEGMNRVMDEVQSLLKRIEDINALPIQEVFRMPPLTLSTEMERFKKSTEDETAP